MWHIYKASYILFFLKYGALSIETGHVAYILYMPHVLFLLIKPHVVTKTTTSSSIIKIFVLIQNIFINKQNLHYNFFFFCFFLQIIFSPILFVICFYNSFIVS